MIMNTDQSLTDVLAELASEPSRSADRIGVTSKKHGVVTLTGHVDNPRA
jgi:hypothetical protein